MGQIQENRILRVFDFVFIRRSHSNIRHQPASTTQLRPPRLDERRQLGIPAHFYLLFAPHSNFHQLCDNPYDH